MKNKKHNLKLFSFSLYLVLICLLVTGFTNQSFAQLSIQEIGSDKVVVDAKTGYWWIQDLRLLRGLTYAQLLAKIEELNDSAYAGQTDWHLASRGEVNTLLVYVGNGPWDWILIKETFHKAWHNGDFWWGRIESGSYYRHMWGPSNCCGSAPPNNPRIYHNQRNNNKSAWVVSGGGPSNNPPEARCKDVTVSADANCQADASINNGTSDPDGDPITISQSPSGPYPLGETEVTLTVTDDKGESSSCTATVSVIDDTAPEISVANNQLGMWPPNHKYKTFTVNDFGVSVTDNCGCCIEAKITGVSSNEPDDAKGGGDGNTKNDIVIVDEGTVKLRAERQGGGDGRVYTITLSATDGSGNTTQATCEVIVPHDRSGLPKGIGGFVTDSEMVLPEDYFLSQNYPNPFNPSTTISFGLPQAENVTLNIYNANGQLIRTLTNAMYSAGTHNVTWDATNYSGVRVANGIYIYELRTNNYTQQRKMLLMK